MAVNKPKPQPRRRVFSGNYMVRVDGSDFYVRLGENNRPLVSPFPSRAQHLSYEEADRMNQYFISIGYTNSVVVDIYGQAIDLAALQAARVAEQEKIDRFWGDSQ
jgi:hypothetical protein